jgi:ribose 5-phosphate isomerase A
MSDGAGAEALKRKAAERAAEWIRDGMTVGLGTGSTVRHLLDVIAERRAGGEWGGIVGVPTSIDTERRATALGIPLATLAERPRIDVTIDGADEVDPALQLIKGLGGALLREKIVANASAQMIVIADESKCVGALGKFALPIEIAPFGAGATQRAIEDILRPAHPDATFTMRKGKDGLAFVTDGGHWIVDAALGRIENPRAIAAA